MSSSKAENALIKANELLEVGGRTQALEMLYEFIKSGRSRYWNKTHESIMKKMIDICIDMKDDQSIRKSFIAYRYLSSLNPNSFGATIDYMLNSIEQKVKTASIGVDINNLAKTVKDLDVDGEAAEAAATLTASAISSSKEKEKHILLPWIQFLWKSYKFVLDLMMRDAKETEQFYHVIASRACKFTQEYQRVTEFRRLCETLSKHLYQKIETTMGSGGNISQTTIDLNLKLRFEQLDVALILHIWNEAFQIIDDIRNLMSLSKRISPLAKANYFVKLSNLFLDSGNLLFHAYAQKQYFILYKENNKSFKAKAEQLANTLTLAVLSIPLGSNRSGITENEEERERAASQRMAKTLGFDENVDREMLLNDIVDNLNIIEYVSNDVRELFNALETDFDPLGIAERALPIVRSFADNENYKLYSSSLENLIINRSLIQLAKVYTTFRLDQFHELLQGVKPSKLEIEKSVIRALKKQQLGSINVTIDHKNACLRFGDNLLDDSAAVLSEIASDLSSIIPKTSKKDQQPQDIQVDPAVIHDEYQLVSRRMELIDLRKQEMDTIKFLIASEANERGNEERRRKETEEAARAAEAARIRQEKEEERRKQAEKNLLDRERLLNSGYDISQSTLSASEQIEQIKKQREKAINEEIAAEKRSSQAVKKYDAFIRAQRESERVILKETGIQRAKESEEQYKENAKNQLISSENEHKVGIERKAQLEPLQQFKGSFETLMVPVWTDDIKTSIEKVKSELATRKHQNKLERARQRKNEADKIRKQEEEARQEEEREAERIRLEEEKEAQAALEAAAEKARAEEAKKLQVIEVIRNVKPGEQSAASTSAPKATTPPPPAATATATKAPNVYVPPSRRAQASATSATSTPSASMPTNNTTGSNVWRPSFRDKETASSSSSSNDARNVPAAFASMRKPKSDEQQQQQDQSRRPAWGR